MSIYPKTIDALALAPEPKLHLHLVEDPKEQLRGAVADEPQTNVRELLFGKEFAPNGEPRTQKTKPINHAVPEWGSSPTGSKPSPTLSWEADMVREATQESSRRRLAQNPSVLATPEQNNDILDRLRVAKPVRWLAVMATSAAIGVTGTVGLSNSFNSAPDAPAALEQLDSTPDTEATLTINHASSEAPAQH